MWVSNLSFLCLNAAVVYRAPVRGTLLQTGFLSTILLLLFTVMRSRVDRVGETHSPDRNKQHDRMWEKDLPFVSNQG